MKLHIPSPGDTIYVAKPFTFTLHNWNSSATAKKFGLGQKKRIEQYKYWYKLQYRDTWSNTMKEQETYFMSPQPKHGEPIRKEDVSYNTWEWTPTAVTIPKGAGLEIKKVKVESNHYRRGFTIKIVNSPNKKLNKTSIYIPLADMGNLEYELAPVDPNEPIPVGSTGRFKKLT